MPQEQRFFYTLSKISNTDKDKLFRAFWANTKIFFACILGFLFMLGIKLLNDKHSSDAKVWLIFYFVIIFFLFFLILSYKYLLDFLQKDKIIAKTYILNIGARKLKKGISVLYINTEVKDDKLLTIAIPFSYINAPMDAGSKIEITVSKNAEVLLDFRVLEE